VQPGARPRGLRVRHGLDDDGGQHGRRRVRVEDQPGADAGGQQDVGVPGERDELHIGDDGGAHTQAPREPERLDGLGRVPGQGDGEQPAAASLAHVQQRVEHDAAAEGETAHVRVDTARGVGEVLGQRRRDAVAEHGQRQRGGQVPAQFGDRPGIRQQAVQRVQMSNLRRHRRLHLVAVSTSGRGAARPGCAGRAGRRSLLVRQPRSGVPHRLQRDDPQRLPERGIAGKTQGGREPGDRRLADVRALGERDAGQEGGVRHVVEEILGDTPLRGRQAAPAEKREQRAAGNPFAAAALHGPSLADPTGTDSFTS